MASDKNELPPLSHVLETILYVRDPTATSKFYQDVLNLTPFLESPRGVGFSLGNTTLLFFQLGKSTTNIESSDGVIPLHGPTDSLLNDLLSDTEGVSLRQHFCFGVSDPEEVERWDAHLQKHRVKILGRMNWERGGKSVYFEDPDGHVGEIGSKGLWPHY